MAVANNYNLSAFIIFVALMAVMWAAMGTSSYPLVIAQTPHFVSEEILLLLNIT
jgi:hypothetical protein